MPSLSRMDQVRDTSGKAAVTELQLIIWSQAQFLPEKSQGKDLQKEWRALMLGIVIRTKRPVNMNIVALLTYKTNADEICNPASTIPLNTPHPAEKSLCSLVRCKNHTNGRNHIKICIYKNLRLFWWLGNVSRWSLNLQFIFKTYLPFPDGQPRMTRDTGFFILFVSSQAVEWPLMQRASLTWWSPPIMYFIAWGALKKMRTGCRENYFSDYRCYPKILV